MSKSLIRFFAQWNDQYFKNSLWSVKTIPITEWTNYPRPASADHNNQLSSFNVLKLRPHLFVSADGCILNTDKSFRDQLLLVLVG